MSEFIPLLRLQVYLLKYHLQFLAGTFIALVIVLFSMVSTSLNLRGQVLPSKPECSDGVNSDPENDATFDYARDVGCVNKTDRRERKDGACFDGTDNDRDGAIDKNDFGCRILFNGESVPLARCQDGKDNDSDGNIDMQDSGCSSTQDPSEN